MKKRISRISVHRTSMVIAILYIIVMILSIPFIYLGTIAKGEIPDQAFHLLMILMPWIYGVLSYVLMVVICAIYNFLAKRLGGIEFILKDVKQKSPKQEEGED